MAPSTFDPLAQPVLCLDRPALGLVGRRRASYELIGSLPPRPRLAVVGSRAAQRRVLRALASMLARAEELGWSLVSGGALGVDGAAHRAALELGMAQLAVLPCGRDRLYPPGHAELFAAMVAGRRAGLLFAHPPGTEPTRGMFASRNEIVVGLADAVLVAEAGLRSGSRGTGRLAQRRGVALAAIAASPGCAALIAAGARPLPAPPRQGPAQTLADATACWLIELAGGSGGAQAQVSTPPPWPPRLAWLATELAAAGPAGLCVDALAEPEAALVALSEAEVAGLVAELADGRWVSLVSSPARP